MVLVIFLVAGGVVAIVASLWRYGFRGASRASIASPGPLLLLLGLGLLTGAGILGYIEQDRSKHRRTLDDGLVKIFGRAPDELALEGRTLFDFRGTARYGDKRYRIEVRTTGGNAKSYRYEVTATPLDDRQRQ